MNVLAATVTIGWKDEPMTESEDDNVLLRPVVSGGGARTALVGQIITVKEICEMIPRSGNPAVDPFLTVPTIQRWLTETSGQDPTLVLMRTATRELAHNLAKRRFETSRGY